VRAFLREPPRRLAADAAGAARDERDLAGKFRFRRSERQLVKLERPVFDIRSR